MSITVIPALEASNKRYRRSISPRGIGFGILGLLIVATLFFGTAGILASSNSTWDNTDQNVKATILGEFRDLTDGGPLLAKVKYEYDGATHTGMALVASDAATDQVVDIAVDTRTGEPMNDVPNTGLRFFVLIWSSLAVTAIATGILCWVVPN